MSDDVYELLSGLKEPPTKSQVVFARHGGKMKQSYVEHKFKQHIRAAGLRDELKFHSLRHTFATWLVQSGASIYEIQKLLGHSDIKTTQIYAHLAASELHSAVNRISFRSRGQTEMRESPSAVK
jgi:site-specific recombinase XerD